MYSALIPEYMGTCLAVCQKRGFSHAGLEYGRECFCGSGLSNGASLASQSDGCTMPCANDPSSTCGGSNAIQLFINPALSAPAVIKDYSSAGCIKEVSGRALTGLRVDDDNMTRGLCIDKCAEAGFSHAGVEYGTECYCGNSLVNGASLSLTSDQCYMDCPGNKLTKCGGPGALQLFVAQSK